MGLAAEFHPHDAALDISGGNDVQQFGGFLAAALEGFGIGGDKVGDDLQGLQGQAVEAGDAAAVASPLGTAHGFRSGDGLLRCVRAGGDLLFSRQQVLEEELELGGVDLLALVAEESPDEVVELLLQQAVGFLERLDPGPCGGELAGLADACLFGRFDGGRYSRRRTI
jgi:hypothetical protein